MKIYILLVALPFFSAFSMSLEDARSKVENYVLEQGYTSKPSTLKPEQLEGASFERTSPSDWLSSRHNMVQLRAAAYIKGLLRTYGFSDDKGWTFGFEYILPKNADDYTKSYAEQRYFVAQISIDGKTILVLHGGVFKKEFNKFKD